MPDREAKAALKISEALTDWALDVEERLKALDRRVGELENMSHVHVSLGPVPEVLPDDD